jgi:hypothetical protein
MQGLSRSMILLAAYAVVLSSCGGAADPERAGEDEFTLPPRSHPSETPQKSFGGSERTISGTLGFDDIEGGCAFVQAADGTRYEVIYPEGWTLDRAAGELRADDGRVAPAGDVITIRGTIATDRSSICQIGPIFVATEVDLSSR